MKEEKGLAADNLILPTSDYKLEDPFPNVSFAITYRWSLVDHWCMRRMQRLGLPDPWRAYHLGRLHEKRQNELKSRET
jgi:hypothetical protein